MVDHGVIGCRDAARPGPGRPDGSGPGAGELCSSSATARAATSTHPISSRCATPRSAPGLAVALVTQPYRVAGRRAPAPAPTLDEAWRAVVGCRCAEQVARRAAGRRWAVQRRPGGLPDRQGRSAPRRWWPSPSRCTRPGTAGADARAARVGPGVPTLVVNGDRDPFGIPAAGRRASRSGAPGRAPRLCAATRRRWPRRVAWLRRRRLARDAGSLAAGSPAAVPLPRYAGRRLVPLTAGPPSSAGSRPDRPGPSLVTGARRLTAGRNAPRRDSALDTGAVSYPVREVRVRAQRYRHRRSETRARRVGREAAAGAVGRPEWPVTRSSGDPPWSSARTRRLPESVSGAE